MYRLAFALALTTVTATADAGVVRGRVVAGHEAGGVADVWVWFGDDARSRSDRDGFFEIEIGDGPGIVWVQVPDGYEPGRAWKSIDGPVEGLEMTLTPAKAPGSLWFVHVSDAHVGKQRYGAGRFTGRDLEHALDQALAHDPDAPPAFFVMTGDLTNRETPSEIAEAAGVLLSRGVPFIPVPGNHDWVAGGQNYRATFGPENYSFDAGGVHFVVLNDNWRRPPDLTFLSRDLETVAGDRMVVAFVHRPPRDAHLGAMEKLGVDALLTGHWHSNRYVEVGSLRQLNTQAIVRGGIDFTPAGYRTVTIENGELSITHGTVVERPAPKLAWPLPLGCVAGDLEVIASAEPRAIDGELAFSIDGGPQVPLRWRGAWAFAAAADRLGEGEHTIELWAGGAVADAAEIRVCRDAPAPAIAPWPQAQGGPTHRGRGDRPIQSPLEGLWAAALGEHVLGGSPAIAGDLVLVPVSDLDDGDGGGVIALDLDSGAVKWRAITGHSVRGTPAVAGELAVFGDASGVVHAVELATGAVRWRADLGEGVDNTQSALISAVAIDGDRVFAVVIGRIAALDLATGERLWEDRRIGGSASANMSSRAAPAVAGRHVIATAGWGKGGLVAFDRDSGARLWARPARESHGINGSPVIAGELVIAAEASGVVRALDRSTGEPIWTTDIAPGANNLSLAVAATPAVAGDVLVVPTQYHSLVALDLRSGAVRWTCQVEPGSVHTAHDQRTAPSVTSSPVITGDVVWFGGVDGVLRAVDLASGKLRWSVDLGAPILAGPAPAGELLVIATYDGVVRAMATGPIEERPSSLSIAALLVVAGFGGWMYSARNGGP